MLFQHMRFLQTQMLQPKQPNYSGVTLVECTVAMAIAAIFLSSLFALNTSSMQTVKMSREASAASQILQQRVESMRIANWHQITDAAWIQNNLLNADAPGSSELNNLSETVTLAPYGSSATGSTTLTRSQGTAQVSATNSNLLRESAVKLVWTVNYAGTPRAHATARQTVAILAKGGVAKW